MLFFFFLCSCVVIFAIFLVTDCKSHIFLIKRGKGWSIYLVLASQLFPLSRLKKQDQHIYVSFTFKSQTLLVFVLFCYSLLTMTNMFHWHLENWSKEFQKKHAVIGKTCEFDVLTEFIFSCTLFLNCSFVLNSSLTPLHFAIKNNCYIFAFAIDKLPASEW